MGWVYVNRDNQERLIAEASKIRDVNKRRKYFKTQGLDEETIDQLIDLVHFRTRGRDRTVKATMAIKYTESSDGEIKSPGESLFFLAV